MEWTARASVPLAARLARARARARAASRAGAGTVILAALAAAAGGAAQPPDTGAPQADALARRATARIEALHREADELASRERTLLEDLRKLQVERDLHAATFDQLTTELARLETDLARTTAGMERLEREAGAQLPNLTARLVEIYKLGNGGYLRLLLGVDDLRGMNRAYRFVSALQTADRARVTEHRRTLAQVREAQTALVARREQILGTQAAAARERVAAAQAASAHEDLIRRIDQRRDLAAQLVGELQEARQKLQRTLDDAGRSGAAPELPLRPFKGDLDWPASGSVRSRFGNPQGRRVPSAFDASGIRLATEPSTPVHAIHDGTVTFAESFQGLGNLVILDHGGLAFSLYGYLAELNAVAGTRVIRGQPVGLSGFALDGSPALYFELRVDGKPVDPLQWLKQR